MKKSARREWLFRLTRKPVAKILAGSLVGQGSILVVSPVLTRIYSPEDFGTFAIITSISAVLGSAANLGFDRAIVIPRARVQGESLFMLSLCSAILVAMLVAAVMFFTREVVAELFNAPILREVWWLVPVTVLFIGLFNASTSLAVRSRSYGQLAARNAALGLSQSVSSVFLGFAGVGTLGLASSLAVGRLAGGLSALGGIPVRSSISRATRLIFPVARRFRQFLLVNVWSRCLNSLGLQIPTLLLVAFYGPLEAGFYALTIRVLASPVGVISDAISQQFEGETANALRNGTTRLDRQVVSYSTRLFLVGLIPATVIATFAPRLFGIVFGDLWIVAGEFAQVAVWAYLAQFTVAPISRVLTLMERHRTQFVWDSSRALGVSGAILVTYLAGGTLSMAIATMTVVGIAAYALLLTLCVSSSRRPRTVAE